MNKREALRIVRILTKACEAGDSDDTLAFYLQQEINKKKPGVGLVRPFGMTKDNWDALTREGKLAYIAEHPFGDGGWEEREALSGPRETGE